MQEPRGFMDVEGHGRNGRLLKQGGDSLKENLYGSKKDFEKHGVVIFSWKRNLNGCI